MEAKKKQQAESEIETMLYFLGISETPDFLFQKQRHGRRQIALGVQPPVGIPVLIQSKQPARQHSFCLLSSSPHPPLSRPSAYRQDTQFYALHPKMSLSSNLRSAVILSPRCFQKPESTSSCVFNSAKEKGPARF